MSLTFARRRIKAKKEKAAKAASEKAAKLAEEQEKIEQSLDEQPETRKKRKER